MSKKEWLLTALMCLLVAGASVAYVKWPRTVPFEQCSVVYQRYANHPGIQASFIKDKYINDSISIPVTLLQAEDSAAWEQLMNIIYSNYSQEARDYMMNSNKIRVRAIPKGHLDLPADSVFLNNDIVAIDAINQTVCIFNLTDTSQLYAITKKYFKEVKLSKTSNT